MSELYLVLRRRLEAVADWVYIGTDVMQEAQDALGLSNERLAARIFISSKTWERWKAKGEVPRYRLTDVAAQLNLRVETPEFSAPPIVLERDALEAVVARLEGVAARFEEALREARPQPRAGKAPR